MGFFDRFKRNKSTVEPAPEAVSVAANPVREEPVFTAVDPAIEQEIAKSVLEQLKSQEPDASFALKRVVEIDVEKELVSVIVGAIAANDRSQSAFRITKVVELERE